jgi:hypothetical protein
MVGSTVGILVGEADVNGVELMAPEPPKASSIVAPPAQPLSPADMLTRGTLPSIQPAGVRVGGTVALAAVNDRTLMPHTAVLFGATGQTFQAAIQSNGAFEFPNVPPGAYDMRVLPLSLPNESTPVLVDTREVTGLRVALPPLSNLRGRVRVDAGRTPPDFSGMTLKLASSLVEIELPLGTDGEFGTRVAHGEYTFSASSVPAGYTVSPGSIVVDAPATKEITIGLRANP